MQVDRREFIKYSAAIVGAIAISPNLLLIENIKDFDKNAEYGNFIDHNSAFPDEFTISALKDNADKNLPKGTFYEIRTKRLATMPGHSYPSFVFNHGTAWYYAPEKREAREIMCGERKIKLKTSLTIHGVEQKQCKPNITEEFVRLHGYYLIGRFRSLG